MKAASWPLGTGLRDALQNRLQSIQRMEISAGVPPDPDGSVPTETMEPSVAGRVRSFQAASCRASWRLYIRFV
jgi:hypothetical protein